jgi:esterase/lipase superfamily enzyme
MYIHGFATSFESAGTTASALSDELNIVTIMFDWASCASIFRYHIDRERVETQAVKDCWNKLLSDLNTKLPHVKVHVVAHSMGNYMLSNAWNDHPQIHRNIHSVFFTAPDVSLMSMRTMVQQMRSPGLKLTLYCSHIDLALWLSYGLRMFTRAHARAGFYMRFQWLFFGRKHWTHPCILNGLDTVDVSEWLSFGLGHTYVTTNAVLEDMRTVLGAGEGSYVRALHNSVVTGAEVLCSTCTRRVTNGGRLKIIISLEQAA